ncbi:MAG: serine hydrolase domain-containing protein [Tepidiformaceae bacterium]
MQTATAASVSATNLEYLDAHIQRYIDSGKLAGAVSAVYRHGELAHLSASGMADRERGLPMAADTVFRIYSMSKPITTVALMQLYERGLFQIDDPVHKYIPEWKDLRVYVSGNHPNFITAPVERAMTVRDLLSHQSGLTYGFMERTNVDAAYRKLGIGGLEVGGTLRGMVEQLATLPLEFSPGTRWNYSVSTDVLGHLVEVISGERFDKYLDAHIFEPLGMKETGFSVRPEQAERFAANYAATKAGLRLIDDPKTSAYLNEPTFFSGGGGLVSTIGDYVRFCQMLLGQGQLDGVRILGRKTLELMTSNHLPDGKDLTQCANGGFSETTYAGVGFGLGFSVTLDSAKGQVSGTPGEYAWGGAASTAFWVDPIEDLAFVFMTQLMPSTTYPLRREFRAIVYGAIE